MDDVIDGIEDDLARVRDGVDTSGLAVTGRLLRLARHVASRREAELRAFDLTVADYDVLATLRRRAGTTGLNPRDVQRSVMVTSGGMTKRLDRLEEAGLVERRPDPDDRRGVRIRLTRKGLGLIDRALERMLAVERTVVAEALPASADRDRLVALLRTLMCAFEQADPEAVS